MDNDIVEKKKIQPKHIAIVASSVIVILIVVLIIIASTGASTPGYGQEGEIEWTEELEEYVEYGYHPCVKSAITQSINEYFLSIYPKGTILYLIEPSEEEEEKGIFTVISADGKKHSVGYTELPEKSIIYMKIDDYRKEFPMECSKREEDESSEDESDDETTEDEANESGSEDEADEDWTDEDEIIEDELFDEDEDEEFVPNYDEEDVSGEEV